MALNFASPFPLFSPNLSLSSLRPAASSTDLRFSHWNNAEPFVRRQREQKEIEDELRRHRSYQSAIKSQKTTHSEDLDPVAVDSSRSSSPTVPNFKSRGTPSAPYSPSIPGRASKYFKSTLEDRPAFRRIIRPPRPAGILAEMVQTDEETSVSIGEKGISYKIKNSPLWGSFEFVQ